MKNYSCSDFFSEIKYVSLVTPENIQNTCRALTMTLNPRLEPNSWRKLAKSPRFSFHNYVHPQELSIVYVKIWGCLSSNRSISELRRSWMTSWRSWNTNKYPYFRSRWSRTPWEASKYDFQHLLRFFRFFETQDMTTQ